MQFQSSPATLVLTVLGLIGIYGMVRYFMKRTMKDGETVNYTPLEAVGISVAIYFVGQLLAGLVIGLVASAFNVDGDQLANTLDDTAGYQFLFILLVETISIGLLYLFMKRRQTVWRAIGWVRPQLRDIGYAVIGFVVYFAVYALVVFNLITEYFPQIDTDQAQQLGFNTTSTGPELIFIFLSLVILPPLVEEILVRGFLYTGLRQRMHVITAAVVASLVFAAAHLQWGSGAPLLWTAAADTFVLSMVLIALRQKTGSLWPGIGVHFIKNCIAFLALFVFKVT